MKELPGLDTFRFLHEGDWAVLLRNARRASYARGAVIIAEGTDQGELFVLRAGHVLVERATTGHGIALARLGPGEIFGEMSFLESAGASASIVAEEEVEADAISVADVRALLSSEPGFSSRLYQSLAVTLAARLRRTSALMSRLSVNDVSQVNRFHAPCTGQITARQIPEGLAQEVALFTGTVRTVSDAIAAGRTSPADCSSRISSAADRIVAQIETFTEDASLVAIGYRDLLSFRDTSQLSAGVGGYVFRETFPVFMTSATMARCYSRPRGFADDFETIRLIQREEPDGDGWLGPLLDRWFLSRPLCTARRNSRRYMADQLRSFAHERNRSQRVAVTSLACGTAAEIVDTLVDSSNGRLHVTCIDADDSALRALHERAESQQLSDRMTLIRANALHLASGATPLALAPQTMIYALGFCEYLDDDEVVTLLDWADRNLDARGRMVWTNLARGNADKPLMDHILDWKTIHRSEADVRAIVGRSSFSTGETEIVPEGADLRVTCAKTR